MPRTVDAILEDRDLAVEDLVSSTGMHGDRIHAIATGRWTPSPSEREKIAAALELDLDEISWGHSMNPRNVRYHRFGIPKSFDQD